MSNLYAIALLPDGQTIMTPYLIEDRQLMWEEIAVNDARNRAIREGKVQKAAADQRAEEPVELESGAPHAG